MNEKFKNKSILEQSMANMRARALHNLRLCLIDLASTYYVGHDEVPDLKINLYKDCNDIVAEITEKPEADA